MNSVPTYLIEAINQFSNLNNDERSNSYNKIIELEKSNGFGVQILVF